MRRYGWGVIAIVIAGSFLAALAINMALLVAQYGWHDAFVWGFEVHTGDKTFLSASMLCAWLVGLLAWYLRRPRG